MAKRKRDMNFKNIQKKENHKRVGKNLNQKLLFILACEGSKTERYYFTEIFNKLKEDQNLSKQSCVFAPHDHTNPTGVLKDLFSYKDISTGKTYKDFEQRWIVIDRDEERTNGGGHTLEDFNRAFEIAATKSVNVAYSNPSFELWYLLHFDYYNTPIDRDLVIKKLSEKLDSDYKISDYKKNISDMFELLEDKIGSALIYSQKLLKNIRNEGLEPADANPSTTVCNLICELVCDLYNTPENSRCSLTNRSCTRLSV